MYRSDTPNLTAKCGCKITMFVESETQPCMCGRGCWNDDYTFDYDDIEIVETCEKHGAEA